MSFLRPRQTAPLILLALAGINGAHADAQLEGFDNPDRIPNQFVVLLNKTPGWAVDLGDIQSKALTAVERAAALAHDRAAAGSIARELAGSFRGKTMAVYGAAIKGFSVQMAEADARLMASDRRIAVISADLRTTGTSTQTNAPWDLARIAQRSLPLNTTYTYYLTGPGENIYVFDTGIQGAFGWDIYTSFYSGCYNETTTQWACMIQSSGTDCSGHGTEVASLINDATYGVAKNATVFDVRTQDCQNNGTAQIWAAGIEWILHNSYTPSVINISSSTNIPQQFAPLAQAIGVAQSAGWIFISGAGPNNTGGVDSCQYLPSGIAGVITVSSTDQTDAIATFSPTGNCISLYAPGVNVGCKLPSGQGTLCTGQSFSVPQASGVAALWLNLHSGGTNEVARALTAAATGNVVHPPGGFISTVDLLLSSCVPGNNANLDPNAPGFCGAGAGGGNPNPPPASLDATLFTIFRSLLFN
jgi:hypothetical protein